jgi:16S rRNA (guanine527-N7)-methyltransferase
VAVSRETEQVAQHLVVAQFGDASQLAYRYVELLATDGLRRGLVGPRELPRIWSRHVLNCVVVHPLIPPDSAVADLGSGAGLPGVVLALARPDLAVTLVEPLLRRARFLQEVTAELRLSSVRVERARAEDLAGTTTFDVVVARAVAPLERLAAWALPLCRPGGSLLAIKGASASEELARARRRLTRLGAGPATIHRCGDGVVDPATTVIRLQSREATPTPGGSS